MGQSPVSTDATAGHDAASHEDTYHIQHKQQIDITYEELIWRQWKQCIKEAVDDWVMRYYRMISSWCIKAQRRYRLDCCWEDLRNDSIVEAYRYAEKFNPLMGEMDHYLNAYFSLYPTRHDVIARYTRCRGAGGEGAARGEGGGSDGLGLHGRERLICNENYNGHSHLDYCIDNELTIDHRESALSIIRALPESEMIMIRLRYSEKGLNNCQIASLLGVTESAVRYQLKKILGKLKVKGDGS